MIHEKLSLNFIGCVMLGVVAMFVVVANREVLGNAADTVSGQIYASVASATENMLCYPQSDIDAKKTEEQTQKTEFSAIPTKIAFIDNQVEKLQTVIDSYNAQIIELQKDLVPEDRFKALQAEVDQISKKIEDTSTYERLSSTRGDLSKQVSLLKKVSDTANTNVVATKKLLDASLAQLVDYKKIKPTIHTYQQAKDDLAEVTSQLAAQKELDNKALEVAQAKLKFDKDGSAVSQNIYDAKNNEYQKLYTAYKAKFGADAFTNNGPITYTELAKAKDRIASAFTLAENAYKTALVPYNETYKNKASMSEADLTDVITHIQSQYDTAKANADSLSSKLAGLQKELQDTEASLAKAGASIGVVVGAGESAGAPQSIASLREQLVDLNKNLETLDLSDGNAKSQISALQIKIDAMKSSLETLASQKADLKARYIVLEGSIKKLDSDIVSYSLSVCKN